MLLYSSLESVLMVMPWSSQEHFGAGMAQLGNGTFALPIFFFELIFCKHPCSR